MALPLLPAIGSFLGSAATGLGSFLGTQGGGALAGAALPYLPDIARGAYNYGVRPAANFLDRNVLTPFNQWAYPEQNVQETPLARWLSPQEQAQQQFESSQERQAQRGLLSQLQQPQNVSFDPIRQRAIEQYEERIKPGIMQRYANMNLFGSGPHQQELRRGESDLAKSLAALEAEWQRGGQSLDLQRLGNLGIYLTGQQQLGLASQQAQAQQQQQAQNLALQQLGLGGQQSNYQQNLALQTQLADLDRLVKGINADIQMSEQGLHQTREPIYSAPQASGLSQLVRLLGSGISRQLNL